MKTKKMTTTAATEIASTALRQPGARPRKAPGAPDTPAPKRGRRPRLSRDALVTSLAEMVNVLIKENRQLKRALARVEKTRESGNLVLTTKALSGLQRRLARVLDGSSAIRPRSTTAAAASIRTRRRVTDPDVLERRRQALAKARAVREARRRTAGE